MLLQGLVWRTPFYNFRKSESLEKYVKLLEGGEDQPVLLKFCALENNFFKTHGSKVAAQSFSELEKKHKDANPDFLVILAPDKRKYLLRSDFPSLKSMAFEVTMYLIAKENNFSDYLVKLYGCGVRSEEGKRSRFYFLYDYGESFERSIPQLRQNLNSEAEKVYVISRILEAYQTLYSYNIAHGGANLVNLYAVNGKWTQPRLGNFFTSSFIDLKNSLGATSPVLRYPVPGEARYSEYPAVATLLIGLYHALTSSINETKLASRMRARPRSFTDTLCRNLEGEFANISTGQVITAKIGRLRVFKVLCDHKAFRMSAELNGAYMRISNEISSVQMAFYAQDL